MNNQYLCLPGQPTFELPDRIEDTTYKNPADWFVQAMTRSNGDVVVSGETILTHGPIWRAVNLLAGDIGQLPLHVMKRTQRQEGVFNEKDRTHPASKLLRLKPNAWQTASVFKECMMQYALIYGNAVAQIVRDQRMQPTALIPHHPTRVVPEVFQGVLLYHLIDDRGRVLETLFDDDVMHITGLRSDGIWGLSVVDIAKKDFGLGMQLRDHGYNHFKNGARPGGVLEHPDRLAADDRQRLRQEWNQIHQGTENSGAIAVLWEGMQYRPVSISNSDSEWLNSRHFDRETVANWFGIPAFKLNEMENSAVRANLEEQNRDYYQTSLSRWTNRIAEEGGAKLLSEQEQETESHYLRWFPEAFMKGDTETRYASYSTAIASEFLSPNEVRELEDLNPRPGGDEYRNPAINPQTTDTGDTMQTLRELVTSRCEHLISAEARSVKQAAKNTKNFIRWVDKFYADKFIPMADDILHPSLAVASSITGDQYAMAEVESDPVSVHGYNSKAAIFEVADYSSKADLVANITALVEEWPGRAGQLATSILEG